MPLRAAYVAECAAAAAAFEALCVQSAEAVAVEAATAARRAACAATEAESAALRERTPVPEPVVVSLTDVDALVAGVALLLPLADKDNVGIPEGDNDVEAQTLHTLLGDAAAEPLEHNDTVSLAHADAQAETSDEVEAVSNLEGDDDDETEGESEGEWLTVNVVDAQPD